MTVRQAKTKGTLVDQEDKKVCISVEPITRRKECV